MSKASRSRTLGLDRNELGGLLVQAGIGTARDHAMISLLAMNGFRISEALGSGIEDLDTECGHRRLKWSAARPASRTSSMPSSSPTKGALTNGGSAKVPSGWLAISRRVHQRPDAMYRSPDVTARAVARIESGEFDAFNGRLIEATTPDDLKAKQDP